MHCDLKRSDKLFAYYYWVILHTFLLSAYFFFKINFFEKKFRNTIRVSNSLEPDQARHFVGPDLDPNCLQKLSANDTSRQRVYEFGIMSNILSLL